MSVTDSMLRKFVDLVVRKDNAGSVAKLLGLLNPEPTAITKPSETKKGWQCPKCNNVYGPHVSACQNCNEAAKTEIDKR